MRYIILVLLSVLICSDLHAQIYGCGFEPSHGGIIHVPAGKPYVIHVRASGALVGRGRVPSAHFEMSGPSWATIHPTGFTVDWAYYGTQPVDVTITIQSDTPQCYPAYPWIYIRDDSNTVSGFYSLGAIFYDPTLVGHVRRPVDTVLFQTTPISMSAQRYINPLVDSFPVFRNLLALSVPEPFSIEDSIPILYSCYSTPPFAWFRPKKAGTFIETAYLLDTLTNDTIPVVLKGTAYDAGVEQSAAENIRAYPNPCHAELTVDIAPAEPSRIEIQNVMGERLYERSQSAGVETIDCSGFPNGIYMVCVTTGNSRKTTKVVIDH